MEGGEGVDGVGQFVDFEGNRVVADRDGGQVREEQQSKRRDQKRVADKGVVDFVEKLAGKKGEEVRQKAIDIKEKAQRGQFDQIR